jgi:phosphoribosylaminoimidazole-succinocarboxamide synthase
LGDPMINEYHIRALGYASDEDIATIKKYTFQINELMKKFFSAINVDLIDFKLEFGKFKGKIILADEISPDTCRLWEKGTGRKLDKDRFRKDLGNIEEAYQEILSRVTR